MKKMDKKGFTIVELVIVIAVIAILAAILIPTFSNIVGEANKAKLQADLKNAYTEYVADVADGYIGDPKAETPVPAVMFDMGMVTFANDATTPNIYYFNGTEFVEGTMTVATDSETTAITTYNGYTLVGYPTGSTKTPKAES